MALKISVVAVLSLGTTFALAGSLARADVGEADATARAGVASRPMFRHVFSHVNDDTRVWENDAEPEERRCVVVTQAGKSVEERFERSSVSKTYSLEPSHPTDLGMAASPRSVADFRSSTLVAKIASPKLGIVETFYRGARFGYEVSRSDAGAQGVRNYGWIEFPRGDLAERIRAFRACAKTGECGE